MLLRINELKLPVGYGREALEAEICRILHIQRVKQASGYSSGNVLEYEILHRSLDARKKPDLFYVYTVDVKIAHPQAVARRLKNRRVTAENPRKYRFPFSFSGPASGKRPVVVGSGPAGLFCTLMLSRAGLRPLLLERGEAVEERTKSVERFWKNGRLDPSSNVQFGEGGAGTFSDGKLNTLIKDPDGRIRFVLGEFVKAGADPSILWEHKPHIGTDALALVVRRMREEILSLGGEVRFSACVTGLTNLSQNGGYRLEINHGEAYADANDVVLAIGHSARDTVQMLRAFGMEMEAKAFAVGLRAEHPQEMINRSMYRKDAPSSLGAASYKLTHKCENGRGVYSFCMCPGGYVVNASSEDGRTAVNGMSYSGRDGKNANSAIVVTVTPDDYRRFCNEEGDPGDPLLGIAFQRRLEEAAFRCAGGKIPVQRLEDFCQNTASLRPGSFEPQNKGQWQMANLRQILPEELNASIIEGMHAFSRRIPGFDSPDVLLSAVESRTSSPVQILRDSSCESTLFPGIFPCGEGAGYAGGITSAAVDGIRVAEALCRKRAETDKTAIRQL